MSDLPPARWCKLTTDQAREVLLARPHGKNTVKSWGERYGVSGNTIVQVMVNPRYFPDLKRELGYVHVKRKIGRPRRPPGITPACPPLPPLRQGVRRRRAVFVEDLE